MHRIPSDLLSVDTNAKTIKGQKQGFMTGILYLAPSNMSGVQYCPMAELAGCESACLYTAGRGAMNSVQLARLNRSEYFNADRAGFMRHIAVDIARLVKSAAKKGYTALVRLNGTSDIRWESIPVVIDADTARKIGKPAGEYLNIHAVFPTVQFYDYTKIANRRGIPANYDLTFSYSGLAGFQPFVAKAQAHGMRIAAVFRNREDIPASFLGMDCVDGDNSDIRHLDPKGVIVALYAKGQAKHDTTGFVVDSPRRVIPVFAAAA